MKTIAVIGAGYVGLVTGSCFAQLGNNVIIVEKDEEKIATLLNGYVPFYEPGLDNIVATNIKNKRIVFVKSIAEAMHQKPAITFSCVGTPSAEDGSADLSFVWQAAEEIGQNLLSYSLIVNKSTVPVGTAQKVLTIIQQQLHQRNKTIPFDVASNPEFLKEGDAVNDFMKPDRVVIGISSEPAREALYELYKPLLTDHEQFVVMNPASAELTKYAANSMLATRISFMNQVAALADAVGADVSDVKLGMSLDKRIGKQFLNAGVGYGGSCFPKDVKALVHMGKHYKQPMTLVQEVDAINNQQRLSFINMIIKHYNGNLRGKKVGIWGLAFKPETDDIRCSPAIDIINKLLEHHATIYAYDPVAMENMKKLYPSNVIFCENAHNVISQSDALIIVTEWEQFTSTPLETFMQLKDITIFDGRNCFEPRDMQTRGIQYFCVGRNSKKPQPNDTFNAALKTTHAILS